MAPIKKYYPFTLDLKRESNVQLKGVVDGDTGNVLQIGLTADGIALDPYDVDVARVILNVRSNSGWRSQDSALDNSGITIADGLITIELFAETYDEGNNYAQIEIYTDEEGDDDVLVTTQHFTFYAKHGTQDDLLASDAYPALIAALKAVYDALNDLYGIAGIRENLLPDAIPQTDDLSAGNSTLWKITRTGTLSLPSITEGKWFELAFPANRSDVRTFRLERLQRSGSTTYGRAAFLEKIKAGDYISCSFDMLTNQEITVGTGIENGTTISLYRTERIPASTKWQTVSFSFTVSADWDTTANGSLYLTVSAAANTATASVKVRSIKFERAPLPSAYIPAADDIKSMYATAVRTIVQQFDQSEKTQALKNVGIFRGTAEPSTMTAKMDEYDLYFHFREV